ncbi:hypothetical protein HanLR1_Chr14g0511481 [Helianthus annuus]|nr:hypothetical protein HanLR1_Chr14g0511481 [Helianthus annuus]
MGLFVKFDDTESIRTTRTLGFIIFQQESKTPKTVQISDTTTLQSLNESNH